MGLPEQLNDETFGQYRERNNLPQVFEAYYRDGKLIQWQEELLRKPGTIAIKPYGHLIVGKAFATVYVAFTDREQINELTHEWIISYCTDYGRDNAVVPSLEALQQMYELSLREGGTI